MKTKYNKLVRDKIPSILDNKGIKYLITYTDENNHLYYLLKKLIEEAHELSRDKDIEELADVMEVLLAIGEELGYSLEDILINMVAKRDERGGFDGGIILIETFRN
jgi:predicted house-cleaning noncanonical NTP pyrophosphatase (MazG superfamily)